MDFGSICLVQYLHSRVVRENASDFCQRLERLDDRVLENCIKESIDSFGCTDLLTVSLLVEAADRYFNLLTCREYE